MSGYLSHSYKYNTYLSLLRFDLRVHYRNSVTPCNQLGSVLISCKADASAIAHRSLGTKIYVLVSHLDILISLNDQANLFLSRWRYLNNLRSVENSGTVPED